MNHPTKWKNLRRGPLDKNQDHKIQDPKKKSKVQTTKKWANKWRNWVSKAEIKE